MKKTTETKKINCGVVNNDPHHLRVIKETESSTIDVTENEIKPQCTGHDVSTNDDNITDTVETELRPAEHVVYNEISVAIGGHCLQQETQITLGVSKNCNGTISFSIYQVSTPDYYE